ncbi:MAG TPA: hypothetical protein VFQ28_11135, partial [Gaiella sp.]|nr:hypothetical protein [Gaiella sp.]
MAAHDVSGPNAAYVAQLLADFRDAPASVPDEWRRLFESDGNGDEAASDGNGRPAAPPPAAPQEAVAPAPEPPASPASPVEAPVTAPAPAAPPRAE